jgi:hypothetical protein
VCNNAKQVNITVNKLKQSVMLLRFIKSCNIKSLLILMRKINLKSKIQQLLIEQFIQIDQMKEDSVLTIDSVLVIIDNSHKKNCKILVLLRSFIRKRRNFSNGVTLSIIMEYILTHQLMDCEAMMK